MPTVNNNRKILDLKRWESCATAPAATQTGAYIVSSRCSKQLQLYVRSGTEHYLYYPEQDSWIPIPSGTLSVGLGAAGVCGIYAKSLTPATSAVKDYLHASNPDGTLNSMAVGYKVLCTGGSNAGQIRTVTRVDTNRLYFDTPLTNDINFGDTFKLYAPIFYVLGSASTTVKAYIPCMTTWITLGSLPANTANDSRLVATPSMIDGEFKYFESNTATSATSTTLVVSTKSWITNIWANRQVRITAGTGAGQIRTISSSNATTITVSSAFTVTPDATSQFVIEGNDDYLYYITANSNYLIYRFSYSGNSWVSRTSRANTASSGVTGHWIHTAPSSGFWTPSSTSGTYLGDRIYMFRGGNGNGFCYYSISTDTWNASVQITPGTINISTGTKSVLVDDEIYICPNAGTYWYAVKVDAESQIEMRPVSNMPVTQGSAVMGDTAFDASYKDGTTVVRYIYILLNSSNLMYRMMII